MIINGDCILELDKLDENSIDVIVTDPPYELNFMNKGWDNAGISFNKETWNKCLRVLKPGGYLLAFGGTRTYHRIACAIEDAGFEIRDCIMWLYGSGFPKSMNIGLAIDKKNGIDNRTGNIKTDGIAVNSGSGCYNWNNGKDNSMKQGYEERIAQNKWKGWGTALKPAYEPIIVARKPFKGSCVDNVIENGVGGINIDDCRIGEPYNYCVKEKGFGSNFMDDNWKPSGKEYNKTVCGRFPANVILDDKEGETWRRYFYCTKASKKDRDEGLDCFEQETTDDGRNKPIDNPYLKGKQKRYNTHPTVKPTELMQYLIRLVAPQGSTILDPFMGSGSTGKAVEYENKERNVNYKFIGIEMNSKYCKIAEARINYVRNSK